MTAALPHKLFAEFIGTFFLTLTICLTAVFATSGETSAAFPIAAVLMLMIYSLGHISGAHFNPAVTLSIWMGKKINRINALLYIVDAGARAFRCDAVLPRIQAHVQLQEAQQSQHLLGLLGRVDVQERAEAAAAVHVRGEELMQQLRNFPSFADRNQEQAMGKGPTVVTQAVMTGFSSEL